jgi:hypothetical protein
MGTKWIRAAMVTALALTVGVGGAFAAGEKKDRAAGNDAARPAAEQKAAPGAAQEREAPAAAPRMDAGQQHQVEGEVTQIDKKKGTVTLRAEDGRTMNLHFPAAALQDIDKGDRVTVEMSIREAGAPAAAPGATDRPAAAPGADLPGPDDRPKPQAPGGGAGPGGTGAGGTR